MEIVIREGDSAPGIANVDISNLIQGYAQNGTLPFNNEREIAFISRLDGSGTNNTNNSAIWSERTSSGFQLLARSGANPSGTLPGELFIGFTQLRTNDDGKKAILAWLDGPGIDGSNSQGLWTTGNDNELALIVRRGDQAPDTETGVLFNNFSTLAMNNLGQTAFIGAVSEPGSLNDVGVWAQNSQGELKLIVVEEVAFDVNDDPLIEDLKIISNLQPPINNGGFNDRGQLIFVASFTDGTSGIFISNKVEFPLPLLGDVNLDGLVNLLDIGPFLGILSSGGFQLEADINQDGVTNLLDILPFVSILSGGKIA